MLGVQWSLYDYNRTMIEDSLDILLEEAIGTVHGLPPGMVTAARIAGTAVTETESSSESSTNSNTVQKSPTRDRYRCEYSNNLTQREKAIVETLVGKVNKSFINKGVYRYSRIKREKAACAVVNCIIESPGDVQSKQATQTILNGSDQEIIELSKSLSREIN